MEKDQHQPPLTQEQELTESILTEDYEEEERRQSQKSWFKRTFGPIENGSMRGAIFALLASAMGVGVFNLPFRISQIGIVGYSVFLLSSGLFSYLGMYLMSRAILQFKVDSFSSMSKLAYGYRFQKVAEFCVIFLPWSGTVSYQVLFPKFIIQLLYDNFGVPLYEGDEGRQVEQYSQLGNWVRIAIAIGSVCINLFFILKKNIGILEKISLVGVIAISFNSIVIFITFLAGFTSTIEMKDGTIVDYQYHGIAGIPWGDLNWFQTGGWDILLAYVQAFSSIMFCYVSHHLVFPLLMNLRRPTKKRIGTIFSRVHVSQVSCYYFLGMIGYLLLAEHNDRVPINSMVMASIQTIPISIGKFLLSLTIFFALPLNLFPARQVMFESFGIQKTNRNHILISLGLTLSGTLIAILFANVNSYLGLIGGTAGVMTIGVIPTVCYYKLIGLQTWKEKAMAIFMGTVSVIGGIGGILSVVFPA